LDVGVYHLTVNLHGYVPLRIPYVLITPDGVDLGNLLLNEQQDSTCIDLNGNGNCSTTPLDVTCVESCSHGATSCESNGKTLDCDDDADGEPDVEERGEVAGIPRCTCSGNDGCDGDPTAYDRNHNGICDV